MHNSIPVIDRFSREFVFRWMDNPPPCPAPDELCYFIFLSPFYNPLLSPDVTHLVGCLKMMSVFVLFRIQVGRMGCVPACGGNGNSRNVSCSKPSLQPPGERHRGAIQVVDRLQSAFISCSDALKRSDKYKIKKKQISLKRKICFRPTFVKSF